ncbi:methionine-R-sulfoxide reductase [Pneumocystis carinii B80]|uniref:Peptide-methionine (R)-S-oxide reductase n=1 Tax=Pneumocystis carinii (strain B80) TaxID=1408658 RepID=A0A0W4ZQZ7_PNEC8|nr:methionine-R-sulfoxide reductase [Pneumocystis carinii B80]KTW30783.1 methionine-R-sulfoxide reductase [Pneumocystis carinii B80]
MRFPIRKSAEEWKKILCSERYKVLREKYTEPAGSGEYDSHYPSEGVYICAGCESPLYKAETKFKSGCGWPSFYESIENSVDRVPDLSGGRVRTEILCSQCGGHLGHVFKGEGFDVPTDERHCVNSLSVIYKNIEKKNV